RFSRDWSSHVCSSDLVAQAQGNLRIELLIQYALNDKVFFDVYIRTLDGSKVYLENITIAIDFDTTAFNSPRAELDKTLSRFYSRSEERRVGKECRSRC